MKSAAWATIGALAFAAGCAVTPMTDDLVLLTRDGCVQTETFRQSLDQALRSLGQPPAYRVVNQDTLAAEDWRNGYPTPTLLYKGRDVFGLPEPGAPYPEPT